MPEFPFFDKYGRITYSDTADAFVRHHTYIILENGAEILCIYDETEDLYTLPTPDDLQVNAHRSGIFTTTAYITENKHPIKEEQTYLVYAVAKGELPDKSFRWCLINDILLNKIAFDSGKLTGIKNLIVRFGNL